MASVAAAAAAGAGGSVRLVVSCTVVAAAWPTAGLHSGVWTVCIAASGVMLLHPRQGSTRIPNAAVSVQGGRCCVLCWQKDHTERWSHYPSCRCCCRYRCCCCLQPQGEAAQDHLALDAGAGAGAGAEQATVMMQGLC